MRGFRIPSRISVAPVATLAVAAGVSIALANDVPVVEPVDVDPPPAENAGQSAAVADLVFPVVTRWEEVLAHREARLAAGPVAVAPPRPSRSEYLPAYEYNLPEDPWELIAKRRRIAASERAARAAIAAGRRPVSLFGPHDPAVNDLDMSVVDELFQWALPPAVPARDRFVDPAFGDARFPPGAAAPLLEVDEASGDRRLPSGDDGDQGWPAPTDHIDWQGINDTGRPSDATCAVGAAHVGIIINRRLAFYTKDGSLVRGPVDFEDWWAGSPGPRNLFDPKIIYDNHNNRWVMMALEGARIDETYYAVSISQTSNPEGAWWTYYFRSDTVGGTDTDLWADYPGLGFDSGSAVDGTGGGAVYITSNQFTAGDSFQYAKLRLLYKYQIYNGAAAGGWEFWNSENENGSKVFTWKPAMTYSGVTSGGNPVLYLLNTRSGGADWITRWRLTNPLGRGPTLGGPVEIGVNSYDVPPAARQQGGGSTLLIDTSDCRTQDVQYRAGHVYMACADVLDWGTPENVEAVLHYFKIDVPTPNVVVWDRRYGADNLYYSYPAIKVDVNQDATIVFNRMGASEFPGIRVTGRLENEGSTQGSALLKAGEATYNPTGNTVERWGDYSGLGVDCAGDRTGVWSTSQYADTTTRWHTWLGGTSFGQTNVFHLNDGDTSGFVPDDRYYTWEVRNADWSGVSLYTAIDGNTNVAASRDCPFGSPYQNSTFGANIRDFIVANGTQYGNEFHHARVQHVGGPTGYRLEARNQSADINVGSLYSGGFTAGTQILDLYEADLTSGKTYAAQLIPESGTADLDLFTFRGSRENGRRADNDGSSQSGGPGATETHVFSASESSKYGFALTNENFASTDYTFKIWLAPLVTPIGNEARTCSDTYTGPTPTLIEGSGPVVWSLVSGPAGMTIDSDSGVVFWGSPVIGSHPVTIRATNPAGFDNEGWTLTINRAAPLVVPIANDTSACGSSYTGPRPRVTDPGCMGPITWSLAAGPAGMTINATTGVVFWPSPTTGRYDIVIRATNTAGSDEEPWRLLITELTPVVNPIGDDDHCFGSPYTGPTPRVTDPACMNPITWSLRAGPSGMTINTTTGVVFWAAPRTGTHPITIRATNPTGFDDESWTLSVIGTPGDVNCDGVVNFEDILNILNEWGPYTPCPPYKPEDADQDCLVGFSDILVVLGNWSSSPPLVTVGTDLPGVSPDEHGTLEADPDHEDPQREPIPEVILINDGVLAPAMYGGVIEVAAHYRQTGRASLSVEIGGASAVETFDLLLVRGHARLDGGLAVRLADGFRPLAGDRFVILAAESTEGTFTSIHLPELGANAEWQLDYGPGTVSLVVVDSSRLAAPEAIGHDPDVAGDFDGDGVVSARDVSTLLHALLANGPAILPEQYAATHRRRPHEDPSMLDLDGDGVLGTGDLNVLLSRLD